MIIEAKTAIHRLTCGMNIPENNTKHIAAIVATKFKASPQATRNMTEGVISIATENITIPPPQKTP